jgi:hypothetical protein
MCSSEQVTAAPGGAAGVRQPARGRRMMARLALVALAASLAACGPKTYRAALVEQGAIAQALVTVQQAEQSAYESHAYDAARHQRYAAVIDGLVRQTGAIDKALADWTQGEPAPAVVTDALAGLQQIQKDQATLQNPSAGLLAAVQQTIALLTADPG